MSVKGCYSGEHLLHPAIDAKRLFDIGLGSLLLLLALPLLLIVSLLVKLTSKGPLFYSGKRLGRNGKLFRCWKFRTMCLNADEKLEECLTSHPEMRREWEIYFKLKKDPRTTLIGRYLRKTSIDELPQLWNVLLGDLSLVGPRPYLLDEVRTTLGKRADAILSVRPGLTGLWQVSGRNTLSFQDRIRLDEEYVSKRSFRLDLLLICKTIPIVFFARGH